MADRSTGREWRCVDSFSVYVDPLTLLSRQNTFWVVDREHDVCFVLFSNLQPYGWQPVFDLWEKVETELYKGLGVRAE